MQENTLSSKLNRIKNATNSIREVVGVTSDMVIEDVAIATNNKITELNTNVEAKTSELAAKQIELDEAIQNREVAITEAVNEVKKNITAFKVADIATMEAKSDMKEDDVCAIVDIQKGYPQQGASVKGALFNSVITLDRPFTEWWDQFTAQLDMVGESDVFLSLRSEDNTCDLMFQFGYWSDQAYLQMYFYDNVTQDSLSADFMIDDLSATTIRAEYAQLRQGGKDTSWTGTSVFLNFTQPLFNSMEMHPGTWLDPFIFFVSQEYNGTYRYSELEGGWVKIPVGMNLEPTKVLQGVDYLTDNGTVTGTFGTDVGSTEQFPTFASFMENIPSTGWKPSGYSSATEVMKLLHKNRRGWNPLIHCIDWNSLSKDNLFYGVSADEFSFDKEPGTYFNKPTTMNMWFYNSNFSKVDLSGLDVSALTRIQNPYAGLRYSDIKEWLSQEITFPLLNLGGYSAYSLGGIIHDLDETVPLIVKNRTYPNVDSLKGSFQTITAAHVLFENLTLSKQIKYYDNMFNGNKKITSICIRNVDVNFKIGTSGSFYYSDASNMFYGCTKLKYIIIDNDEVLNFPAHHPYTYKPTSAVLYCNSALENTPVNTEGAIFVRDEQVASYKSHTMWSYFSSRIKPISEMPEDLKQIYGYTE